MIKYKCEFCDAKLETDNDMSGVLEACPVCKKGNTVPLSKHDQHEQDKQQKAKHRQEHEQEKQRKAATAAAPEPAARPAARPTSPVEATPKAPAKTRPHTPPSGKRKKMSVQAAVTDFGLALGGCLCVIGGVAAAVGCLMGNAQTGPGAELESRMRVIQAVSAFLLGFLAAMPFFAAQLGLKYLRRITRALEAKK
jgi:sRNA-binding protein